MGLRECKIVGNVTLYTKSGSTVVEHIVEKCVAINFHSSRRYFVTKCLDNGVPIPDVMAWTGHTSGTIGKYVKKGGTNSEKLLRIFK